MATNYWFIENVSPRVLHRNPLCLQVGRDSTLSPITVDYSDTESALGAGRLADRTLRWCMGCCFVKRFQVRCVTRKDGVITKIGLHSYAPDLSEEEIIKMFNAGAIRIFTREKLSTGYLYSEAVPVKGETRWFLRSKPNQTERDNLSEVGDCT